VRSITMPSNPERSIVQVKASSSTPIRGKPVNVLRCPIRPVASSTQRPKNDPTMKTLKWAKLISSMMP